MRARPVDGSGWSSRCVALFKRDSPLFPKFARSIPSGRIRGKRAVERGAHPPPTSTFARQGLSASREWRSVTPSRNWALPPVPPRAGATLQRIRHASHQGGGGAGPPQSAMSRGTSRAATRRWWRSGPAMARRLGSRGPQCPVSGSWRADAVRPKALCRPGLTRVVTYSADHGGSRPAPTP